ncbi:hypothetical protein PAMP_001150 [Pampus punctatissimus]
MDILKCYVIPFTGSKLKSTMIWINICCLLHDMTVDCKTVGSTWEMSFEGLCMCMCVFCACATIPSEIQSCDVPFDLHHTTKYSNRVPYSLLFLQD